MQVYFYDTKHELEHQMYSSSKINPLLLTKIIEILRIKPHCSFFRNLKELLDLNNCKIFIKSDVRIDQWVCNGPFVSQVVAMWIDDDSLEEYKSWDVIV